MFEQKLNEKVQLSIKSFYKREVQTEQQTSSHILCTKVGDGFTEAELVNSLDPLRRNWDPDRNYIRLSINQIRAGPKHISFSGRIVNMKTYFGVCTQQQKANGWHYLIIKDDTGAIFVGLFFSQNGIFYLQSYEKKGQTLFCSKTFSTSFRVIRDLMDGLHFRNLTWSYPWATGTAASISH